jgi:hypothetical protein
VALARVAQRWGRIDDPAAYVRRTLYTQSISRLRALRRRPPESLGATPAEPAWHADDLDLRVALDQALRKLTAHQRAVLMLRYHEDLSETQTAQVLGCAVGTVKAQYRRQGKSEIYITHSPRTPRSRSPDLAAAPRPDSWTSNACALRDPLRSSGPRQVHARLAADPRGGGRTFPKYAPSTGVNSTRH